MKTIIDYLNANGCIDDETLAYSMPGEYPFTLEEFQDYTHKVWEDAGGWDKSDEYAMEGAYFETYNVPFEVDGKKYFLNIMYGQGSAWWLQTEKEHAECLERVAELDLEDD